MPFPYFVSFNRKKSSERYGRLASIRQNQSRPSLFRISTGRDLIRTFSLFPKLPCYRFQWDCSWQSTAIIIKKITYAIPVHSTTGYVVAELLTLLLTLVLFII